MDTPAAASKMGLTTILRGFKAPIAVLNRFLVSNGVEETYGIPPSLLRVPGSSVPPLDPQATFLRAKLAAAGDANSTTRIFIPQKQGQASSSYGYVSYAYVMVFGQRRIDLAAALPDQAPPGFPELRREILACAEEGEQALLQVAGMHGGEGEDDASLLCRFCPHRRTRVSVFAGVYARGEFLYRLPLGSFYPFLRGVPMSRY